MSYQTYYGELPREVYADRLRILYPNHGLMVDCLVTLRFENVKLPG